MRNVYIPRQAPMAPIIAGPGTALPPLPHGTALPAVPEPRHALASGPDPATGPGPVLPPGSGRLPWPAAGLGRARPVPPPAPPTDLDATLPSESRLTVCVLEPGSVAHYARALVRDVLLAAGVPAGRIDDAELIVGELGANAEVHACPPYELRVFQLADGPARFELADSAPGLERICAAFARLRTAPDLDPLLMAEHGRGLLMTYLLSGGDCQAYATTLLHTATPGKAVGFSLPGVRLIPSAPEPPSPDR